MAVSLVQAYLRINGYFTVSEYPILEADGPRGYSVATDLDILAFRFPGAGRRVAGAEPEAGSFEPDPALGCPPDRGDMLIGEVKEGRAVLNAAARDPEVLRTALARFGCCPAKDADEVARRLIAKGTVDTPHGHRVRLAAFGGTAPRQRGVDLTMTLSHIAGFIRDYMREHWEVLHHAQFKDPALAFFMVLEKAEKARDT